MKLNKTPRGNLIKPIVSIICDIISSADNIGEIKTFVHDWFSFFQFTWENSVSVIVSVDNVRVQQVFCILGQKHKHHFKMECSGMIQFGPMQIFS